MAEYIEREVLLKELAKDVAVDGNQRAAQILECIINAPAADVAPVVHGRWEVIKVLGKTALYRCTACKEEMADHIGRESFHKYCHRCGAKMDGVEEDA